MDLWLGTFDDEQPVSSFGGVDRSVTSLWIDGQARDFADLWEFESLETLSIYRLPRRHLPMLADCSLAQLTALCIRHGNAEDLTFLSGFNKLRTLTIWQSPKLERLDGIEPLLRLTTLVLNDIGAIESLEPLASLNGLTRLALMGGVWNTQGLPPLAPLAALTQLEQLNMDAAKVSDGDLGPLCELPNLTELRFGPRAFDPEEVARVAAAYPWWRRQLLDLEDFDKLAGTPGCKVCGTHRRILFLRRKKLLWCPSCEGTKLERILADFEGLVEQKLREREQRRLGAGNGRLHSN